MPAHETDVPWIEELLSLELNKKSVHDFWERWLPKVEDNISVQDRERTYRELVVNPMMEVTLSLDLLMRLNFITRIDLSPRAKELYDFALRNAAVAALSAETGEALDFRKEQRDEEFMKKYEEKRTDIDSEAWSKLVKNEKLYSTLVESIKFREELNQRIAAIKKDESHLQSSLNNLLLFGEFLKEKYPKKGIDEILTDLKLYLHDLAVPKNIKVNTVDLLQKVFIQFFQDEAFMNSPAVGNLQLGMDAFNILLARSNQTRDELSPSRKTNFLNKVAEIIQTDLMPNAQARKQLADAHVQLDKAIDVLEKYGKEKEEGNPKEWKNKNPGKSEAALDLVSDLKLLSKEYFSKERKEDAEKEEFKSTATALIKAADEKFGKKNRKRWVSFTKGLTDAVNAVAAVKFPDPQEVKIEVYSKEKAGGVTLFSHEDKLEKESDKAPVKSPRPGQRSDE
jgi:hypothetical protein